jgi:adenine nucleotide transporter 17
LDTATNLLLGCAAEWAHLPISLPVDAWTTKIQTQTVDSSQSHQAPMHILMTMMRDKDTKFYKGLSAYYLLCFKPALQYTVFEQVKAAWLRSKNAKTSHSSSGQQSSLSAAEAFLLGMVARTIATVAVFPFLRAKVVMQTRKTTTTESTASDADGTANDNDGSSSSNNNNNNDNTKKDSVLTLLLEIWQTKGVAGLYQGLGPELTRGIFSAALMLMIKEKIAVAVRTRLR